MEVERERDKRVDLRGWNLPVIDKYQGEVGRLIDGVTQAAQAVHEVHDRFREAVTAAAGEALTIAFTEDGYVSAHLDNENPLRLRVTVGFASDHVDPTVHIDLEAVIREELDCPLLETAEEKLTRFAEVRNALDHLRLMVDECIQKRDMK